MCETREMTVRAGLLWIASGLVASGLVIGSASTATGSVLSAAAVESLLTITGTTSDDLDFRIRGGASLFDQGIVETTGGAAQLGFAGTVDGAFAGDALSLGFADGFVTGDVFDMGVGDSLYLRSFASSEADGPSGFADGFLFGNGALEIVNLSTTAELQVELAWSIFLDAYALASTPALEDGYATADLTFETAYIAAGTNVVSDPYEVIFPLSLTADAIFGPPSDTFSGGLDFSVLLQPGETQFLFLTADTGSTAASLDGGNSGIGNVPLPASKLLLMTALLAVISIAAPHRGCRVSLLAGVRLAD